MGRDTCRMPGCDEEPRDDGRDASANRFCSTQHELKYEHIKADAEDARRAEREQAEAERRDLPEYDGPPY